MKPGDVVRCKGNELGFRYRDWYRRSRALDKVYIPIGTLGVIIETNLNASTEMSLLINGSVLYGLFSSTWEVVCK
jgi:hypothetical protein